MKKTKIFNKCKLIFLFFLIFCTICQNVFCENGQWTVAAEPFLLRKKSDSEILNAACKSLPVLILEQLNENVVRTANSQELLDRKLYQLQKDRISLFLQLSKEVQARDSIFLNDYSTRKLKSKLQASDKTIKGIEEKIAKNLAEVEKLKSEYGPKIKREEENRRRREEGLAELKENKNFFNLFNSSYESPVEENVVLYQNDFRKLYEDLHSDISTDYTLSNNERKLVDSSINCLITGKITSYGNYISVTVTIYNYPGAKVLGTVTDVGSLSDLNLLAQNLANSISPKITDSLPVELLINIEPEEIRKHTVVTVDDVIFKNNWEKITVSGGTHTIQFQSKGYQSLSVSYAFTGKKSFEIQVQMQPEKNGSANLRFTNIYEGSVFYNGNFFQGLSTENKFIPLKISGKAVLGHYKNEAGLSGDFYVPVRFLEDDKNLKVNLKPFDRSKYIDKRRKIMYGSYSLLMVSLMPYFFCYGNYYSAATAYNNKYSTDRDNAVKWQTASNITGGIAIGCGAFFVYELIRYLLAANTVLPAYANELTPAQLKKLEKADEKKIKKLEAQKLKEEKNKNIKSADDKTDSESENTQNGVNNG